MQKCFSWLFDYKSSLDSSQGRARVPVPELNLDPVKRKHKTVHRRIGEEIKHPETFKTVKKA